MGRGVIKIDGEFMNNLRFGNDDVVIANSTVELKRLRGKFAEMSEKAGPHINCEKTVTLSQRFTSTRSRRQTALQATIRQCAMGDVTAV